LTVTYTYVSIAAASASYCVVYEIPATGRKLKNSVMNFQFQRTDHRYSEGSLLQTQTHTQAGKHTGTSLKSKDGGTLFPI